MSRQLKGAILTSAVAAVFLVLEIAFGIRSGIAGIFVFGMAGGLVVGDQMVRAEAVKPAAG